VNVKKLFSEILHWVTYSVNIYGLPRSTPSFDHVANVFLPATIDACYLQDGTGLPGGIKNDQGEWNTAGHHDRIVRVDEDALATFSRLYDEPGTRVRRARLPALHAGALSSVLQKLAAFPRRLADLGDDYVSTEMWHETIQQKDGTIVRRSAFDNTFPKTPEDWVLSGPHFFVANPFYKTPRKNCNTPLAYDSISLEAVPDDYLPRTNYWPISDRFEYRRRSPRANWVDEGEGREKTVIELFRCFIRRRLSQSGERTLISALVPPTAAHINQVLSLAFRSNIDLVDVAGVTASVVADFFVKSTALCRFQWKLTQQQTWR